MPAELRGRLVEGRSIGCRDRRRGDLSSSNERRHPHGRTRQLAIATRSPTTRRSWPVSIPVGPFARCCSTSKDRYCSRWKENPEEGLSAWGTCTAARRRAAPSSKRHPGARQGSVSKAGTSSCCASLVRFDQGAYSGGIHPISWLIVSGWGLATVTKELRSDELLTRSV